MPNFLHEIRFVIVILAVTASGCISGCESEVPEKYQNSFKRPAKDKEGFVSKNLKGWELLIDGVPFEDHPKLKSGSSIVITGKAELSEEAKCDKCLASLLVAIRPEGESAGDWDTKKKYRDWRLEFKGPILYGGKINRKQSLASEIFVPGEYDSRLYLQIWDMMEGHTKNHFIANSKIEIVAP